MSSKSIPHLIKQQHCWQLIVDGQPFTILGGELHNSSASSIDYLEPLLDHLVQCQVNTVLLPICWELIEPVEGEFDFSLVQDIIDAARKRNLKLLTLWFGTMKNAMSCYTPAWVKTDLKRFPRVETTPGKTSPTVSPFGREICECDSRAFAKLMNWLRSYDEQANTVIMMQVENETGILHAARDYSSAANIAFADEVPAELLSYIKDQTNEVRTELADSWKNCGCRESGTWREVFGSDAEEFFMGWHIAKFTGDVAAAGRKEYDLPMFANAWQCHGPGFPPGKYPSGGPIAKMMDIWKVGAPAIDFIAPDIYTLRFREICEDYSTGGNALLIPEARKDNIAASNALFALGKRALGFAPFAIETIPLDHPLIETYAMLAQAQPLIVKQQAIGATTGFVQQKDEELQDLALGNYCFHCKTLGPMADLEVPGGILLIAESEDTYYCIGRNLILNFEAISGSNTIAELVYLDIGTFNNGQWQTSRRLNGDETQHGGQITLKEELVAYRFKIFTHSEPS